MVLLGVFQLSVMDSFGGIFNLSVGLAYGENFSTDTVPWRQFSWEHGSYVQLSCRLKLGSLPRKLRGLIS